MKSFLNARNEEIGNGLLGYSGRHASYVQSIEWRSLKLLLCSQLVSGF